MRIFRISLAFCRLRIGLVITLLLLTVFLRGQEFYHSTQISDSPNIEAFDALSGEELWKKVLEENKGKVIYGEISGTWCVGCLMDYPYLDSLYSVFAEKEVVFVTFWAHSDEDKWKEFSNKYKFKGLHIFTNKEQEEWIMNNLKNTHIKYPTYFILDKKGKIYKSDAPRPSSKYSYKHINVLLSKGDEK